MKKFIFPLTITIMFTLGFFSGFLINQYQQQSFFLDEHLFNSSMLINITNELDNGNITEAKKLLKNEAKNKISIVENFNANNLTDKQTTKLHDLKSRFEALSKKQ